MVEFEFIHFARVVEFSSPRPASAYVHGVNENGRTAWGRAAKDMPWSSWRPHNITMHLSRLHQFIFFAERTLRPGDGER